jgi:hypothetical protein
MGVPDPQNRLAGVARREFDGQVVQGLDLEAIDRSGSVASRPSAQNGAGAADEKTTGLPRPRGAGVTLQGCVGSLGHVEIIRASMTGHLLLHLTRMTKPSRSVPWRKSA